MNIRIKKLRAVDGGAPAIPANVHIPGTIQPEPYSLPVEYEAEGVADELPKVGQSFCMRRNKRNGQVVDGLFLTSNVTAVGKNTFTTANSVYEYEVLH